MAYRLKSTRYGGLDRKILLQNENGPCPLLAAANALLLRGTVSLPSTCVRSGVASIDDVVNMLAECVLGHNSSHHHHIHEMLTLFPTLQFGMDVNPKFTGGPTGLEYTQNITAFELLNVELVHGWLIDPCDTETVQLVGNKTYNELVEKIIKGNDACYEIDRITKMIQEKESQLKEMEEWIEVHASAKLQVTIELEASPSESIGGGIETTESSLESEGQEVVVDLSSTILPPEDRVISVELTPSESITDDKWRIRGEMEVLKKKLEDLSQQATDSTLLKGFLEATGHQLTEYGLQQLNNYLGDNCICVFFRNNHFSTLTKMDGKMYTLVTDLGYAEVPEVVWEGLDAIDGYTEYFNSVFVKPAPLINHSVGSSSISPELLLAQRGQSDADFQFALQLSQNEGGGGAKTQAQLDEEEGSLVTAATQASLRAYHGLDSDPQAITTIPGAYVVENGGLIDALQSTTIHVIDRNSTLQEDQDAMIAQQLNAQMDFYDYNEEASAVLARQLEAEDRIAATRQGGNGRRGNARAQTPAAAKDSSCVIS